MVYADTEWNHRIIFKHKLHYDNLLVQKNWYIFQVSSFIEKMNMNEFFFQFLSVIKSTNDLSQIILMLILFSIL